MRESLGTTLAQLVDHYQTKLGRVIIDTQGEPRAAEIHQLLSTVDSKDKFTVRSTVSRLDSDQPERMIVHLYRTASREFLNAREEQ